jgi:hemoglobin/transferrin/lactoferrin receptor protein
VPGAAITFQSQNVTRARIEGVELRAEARLAPGWTAQLGASALRGDDLTRGVPLNSIDPARVVAGLEYAAPGWNARVHVTHTGEKKRIDTSAATYFAPPAFTVADLTGSWIVSPQVTVFGGVFNLFDRKYWLWSDVRGIANPGASADRYTQPGRNASLRLKFTF